VAGRQPLRRDDPPLQGCRERMAAAGCHLDDVPDPWARKQDSPDRQRSDLDRPAVAVKEHRVDREAHPERVDRPASLQEQTFVGRQPGGTEQAARPLAVILRHEQDPLTYASPSHGESDGSGQRRQDGPNRGRSRHATHHA
jgi:hypothetical protein